MTLIRFTIVGTAVAVAASIAFFPWPNHRDINCEIRENVGKVGSPSAIQSTQKILLKIRDNKPDENVFQSQLVKNIRIHLKINRATLNLFNIFDMQVALPAWQITQVFEDLDSGSKTMGRSVIPKILGDLRSVDLGFFEKPNGDSIASICMPVATNAKLTKR